MNPFADLQPSEEILRQERLHRGVFALPALVCAMLLLPTIPIFIFVKMMGNMLDQVGPHNSFPTSFIWLLPIAIELVPALLLSVVVLVAYLNSEITLTNKRLIYRTGFVVRAAGELPLENVEAILILEPLLGRLLGYGTVTVSTLGGLRLPLRYLAKPQVFHATLQRAVAQAKHPVRPHTKLAPMPQDDSRYMPKR
jgi:hypothetical protein